MPPENFDNAQNTEYSVSRTTLHFPGLEQMGAAGPAGTPCIFVRLHSPYEQEVVQWTARREAGPPIVPSPVDPNYPMRYTKNLILLDFRFTLPILMTIGGGNQGHIWVISGYALYGKVIAEGPICDYRSGALPWEQTSPPTYPNYFPKENFSMDVLDPTPVTPQIPPPRPRLPPGPPQIPPPRPRLPPGP